MVSIVTKIPGKLKKSIFENPQWFLHQNEVLNKLFILGSRPCLHKVLNLGYIFERRIKPHFKNLSEHPN